MADILIDNQTAPTTPASSKSVIWVDSTVKRQLQTDDGGIHRGIFNHQSTTAAQGALITTEVYITGSGIRIPSYGMQLGMTFIWYISASKTAASTAAPVWTWRIGANQTTADTSRLALTSGQAQTAVASDGVLVAMLTVHIASAVGTIAGSGPMGAPGFGGGGAGTSSTFDNTSTIAGQYIGITVTTGTSAAWTVTACSCWGMV